MGGRLDATNVVSPEICCITPIEKEHTEFLGDTVAKIAAEKCGIIKPGIPAVTAAQSPEALAVIRQTAAERNAPSIELSSTASVKSAFAAAVKQFLLPH